MSAIHGHRAGAPARGGLARVAVPALLALALLPSGAAAAEGARARGPAVEVGAGYLYSGGDPGGPIVSAAVTYRPFGGRRLEMGVGVEHYAGSESERIQDPTIGPYTWSYRYRVIPVYLHGRYRLGGERLGFFGEGGLGLFLAQGSWEASNANGAIEPAESFSGSAIGVRMGGGVSLAAGPGELVSTLTYRFANIENAEKKNRVYPQDRDVFDIAGDVGAVAVQVGYQFSF